MIQLCDDFLEDRVVDLGPFLLLLFHKMEIVHVRKVIQDGNLICWGKSSLIGKVCTPEDSCGSSIFG